MTRCGFALTLSSLHSCSQSVHCRLEYQVCFFPPLFHILPVFTFKFGYICLVKQNALSAYVLPSLRSPTSFAFRLTSSLPPRNLPGKLPALPFCALTKGANDKRV